jgi:anti-sigma regulatory factor (Ser/Thr protein kinase)
MAPTSGSAVHSSYRHEACVFHDREQFLHETVRFVRDGVRAGQPVMVAVPALRRDALRHALGADGADVLFFDMAEIGGNPARIIPAWRAFIDEHGADGRPMRGVGEPIWSGRRPAELEECQLHEALLNLAVSPDTPLWLRCPYDAATLPPEVVELAARSHPVVVEGETYRGSTTYGGVGHASDVLAALLPEPGEDVERLVFGDQGLREVRQLISRHADVAGLPDDRATDLVLVVHELAMNSLMHGGGRGAVRVWRTSDALVAEVRDQGRITDLLAGRVIPPPDGESGRGLWLANQLCDLVQVRSTAAGTAVRVHTWL